MESTLALQYTDYLSKVSNFLGWGLGVNAQSQFDPTLYNASQIAMLNDCVASGIRQFYFPPAFSSRTSHDWSFLKPTAHLDLVANAQTVQLPDDCGGVEGDITVVATQTASVWWPVRYFNEGLVRQAYAQTPSSSGPPSMFTIQPLKGTTSQRSSRQQLYLYPQADQYYSLQLQYYILPDLLSGSNPYVYGGAAHVETILESCFAIAEQRLDDMIGLHTAKFLERLGASIAMDRKNKEAYVGRNTDRSDEQSRVVSGHNWFSPGTYKGGSFS